MPNTDTDTDTVPNTDTVEVYVLLPGVIPTAHYKHLKFPNQPLCGGWDGVTKGTDITADDLRIGMRVCDYCIRYRAYTTTAA